MDDNSGRQNRYPDNSAAVLKFSQTMEKDNNMSDTDLSTPHENAPPSRSIQQEMALPKIFTRLKIDTPLFVNSEAASSSSVEFATYPESTPPMMAVALFIFAIVTMTVRKLMRQSRHRAANPFPSWTKLPPCVLSCHPIFGHFAYINSPPDSAKFNAVFADNANSSGVSSLWLLNVPSVSVLKAEHAKIVYRSSVERSSPKIITRQFKRCLGEDSLVMMDGGEADREKWRRHRNLVKVAFTTHAVEKMADKVWKVANGFTHSILRQCANHQDQNGCYIAEASDIFKWVTLDIFGKVALNYSFRCTETLTITPLAQSLNYTIEECTIQSKPVNLINPARQLYWLPTQRNRDFEFHSDNVHGQLRKISQQRLKDIMEEEGSAVNDDLLASLLKSKMDYPGAKQDECIEDTVKMLLTLFFAGFDTSSVLLSMAMWSVVQHPEIQEECAKEAQYESSKISPDEPSLHEDASQWESRLAYCRAVILETLRLHPPVYTNFRNLSRDIELDGMTIPKRTRVYLPVTLIHTDERNFARAKDFLPERWVRRDASTGKWVARDYSSEPQTVDNDPTYLPPGNIHYIFSFGDGARNCIGHRLALQESTIVFACLVRDLVVRVRDGFVMQKRRKFAMAPPKEMPLIFRKREWRA